MYEEAPDWTARWTVVQEVCNRTPVLLPEPVLDDEVRKDKYKSKNYVQKDAITHTETFDLRFVARSGPFFTWPAPEYLKVFRIQTILTEKTLYSSLRSFSVYSKKLPDSLLLACTYFL